MRPAVWPISVVRGTARRVSNAGSRDVISVGRKASYRPDRFKARITSRALTRAHAKAHNKKALHSADRTQNFCFGKPNFSQIRIGETEIVACSRRAARFAQPQTRSK